jgi:hypothetical protein
MSFILRSSEESKEPEKSTFEGLQNKLREDLDDRFSNDLITAIVSKFFENETLRLKASEYNVTMISPVNIEYRETIRELNSHMASLIHWIKTTPIRYDQKVEELRKNHEDALDSMMAYPSPFYLYHGIHKDKHGKALKLELIINHPYLREIHGQPAYYLKVISNIDGASKCFNGPWPSKYVFYHTALIELIKAFSKKETKKKGKRGKPDLSGLIFADYATIFYYATIAKYYSTNNIEVEYARFIKAHNISITTVNFKSAVSDIQTLERRKANDRKQRIEPILKKYYPKAVKRMLLDFGD